MPNRKQSSYERRLPHWSPRWLAGLGVLSVLVFWIPIAAPLIQAMTVIQCLRAARWGVAEASGLVLGIGGALVGFGLFLARSHLGLP